jgi:beta-glucosidase
MYAKKIIFRWIYIIAFTGLFFSCSNKSDKAVTFDYPFQNPSLPLEERVTNMISLLTLEEKISQKWHNSPAIPRLGIPEYNWWNESLHGHARAGRATVFPQAIGMAASFDEDMIFRISTAISDEARAFHHAAIAHGNRLRYGGLTFWTPNINIFRDPRWGRGMETYGEDPFLTSRLGVAYVKGLQGDDPNYLKAAACAKHYVVYSGPEALRHEFNAISNLKDFHETYLPAFKALVKEGNVESIMCAYNRTNDEACCGSEYLINGILREQWGFKGHVVSDCGAIMDFHTDHHVTSTGAESAALALKSGVNLNCGPAYIRYLKQAVEEGLVPEEEIDQSLAILLRTRFRLGMFDPPGINPYEKIDENVVNSDKHRALALEAARKSIVLLKNDDVLPLNRDTRYIYLLGPNANNVEVLLGNYYGLSANMTIILEGITAKVPIGCFIQYKKGFLLDRDNVNPIDWTTNKAQNADVSIVVMGLSPILEGEEGESIASPHKGDLLEFKLPDNQLHYLRLLREGNDKPIVVILTGGSAVDLSEVYELADAVIYAWYPGEEGGNAVADVLYGDISPSGRLPITFPKSIEQLPPFDDYNMTGRTYRFLTEEPLFPFGYGLSYADFEYSNMRVSAENIGPGETFTASAFVKNTGSMPADEVVQFYVSYMDGTGDFPVTSLRGIKRVNLKPGEEKEIIFDEILANFDEFGVEKVFPGRYKLFIAPSSPIKRSIDLGVSRPVEATVNYLN